MRLKHRFGEDLKRIRGNQRRADTSPESSDLLSVLMQLIEITLDRDTSEIRCER